MQTLIRKFEAEIAPLKWHTALTNLETAVRRYALAQRKANFNPLQPRVPAGNPDGGQWTLEGSDTLTPKILAIAKQLRLAASPASYQKCLTMCFPLLERPKPYPWSDINSNAFHKCMAECMRRNP
jgi:hypothetical protein